MPILLFWNRFTNLNDWSAYLGGIFPHLLSWKRDIRGQQKHREEKQDLWKTHHSYLFYNQDPEATEKTTYFVFASMDAQSISVLQSMLFKTEECCTKDDTLLIRGLISVSSQDRPLWDLYYQYHFSDKDILDNGTYWIWRNIFNWRWYAVNKEILPSAMRLRPFK